MTALLIGGTGTLGQALIPKLMRKGYQITVLSRDELKQKQLKAKYPEIEFVIGDIRDRESIERACHGKRAVFHLAAMKHVDTAEANLLECIKINLIGTLNVVEACVNGGVDYAVFSSTDKAVLPINAYGMCKGLSERYWHAANERNAGLFTVFRWGNVLGSRGSVLHSFCESLKEEKLIRITDFAMTRFWIHIDDAAQFMMDSFKYKNNNQTYIPPIKAASVSRLARATATHLGVEDFKYREIPIRPGEKVHEWLDYHDPDADIKSNTCAQYTDEELLELVARSV